MSKTVSALSGIAVLVLLMVLGGTLFGLAVSQSQVGQVTSSSVGTAFTYQGHLTDGQGPANGPFDLTFSLYDDPEAASQVGTTISRTVTITDGLLSLDLDFGSVFDGTALWLEIQLRPAGDEGPYTPLEPRQRLVPTPLATYASIAPWTGLTGVPGGFADGVDADTLASLGCTSGQIPEVSGSTWTCGEDNVGTSGGGGDITAVIAGYGLGGGSASGDASLYVVTETIQIRVDGTCPAGWSIQAINQDGSVLCERDTDTTYSAGAGLTLSDTTFAISSTYLLPYPCAPNQVTKWNGSAWACAADQGGEGSGWSLTGNSGTAPGTNFLGTTDNVSLEVRVNASRILLLEPGTIGPNIVGGYSHNGIDSGLSGATIAGGGRDLAINQVTADFAVIGGGAGNTASGYAVTIGGGEGNRAAGAYATAGGGLTNTVSGDYTSVGGGSFNAAENDYATVGGGTGNQAGAPYASIGGGANITVTANYGAVAGGSQNSVAGTAAAIGGGGSNMANGDYAAIGGGQDNLVTATYGTIAGGGPANLQNPTTTSNRVYDDYGAIGGGGDNVAGIDDGDHALQDYATIGGGKGNAASGSITTVGGGASNAAGNRGATVSGGEGNSASNMYATVGGGSSNTASGSRSVVAGGQANSAISSHAAVGGGSGNKVGAGLGTIGGGGGNVVTATYGTIGGGLGNEVSAGTGTIGGGAGNVVTATYGTIPGGLQNYVSGDYGFAAGYLARAEDQGSFVWSDATGPFTTTAPNQFLIDASGGVGIGTNRPDQMLTVQGSGTFLAGDNPVARDYYTSSWRLLDAPGAVYAAGSEVYVTSYSTNTLAVFDASDPDNLVYIGYSTSNLSGPRDVFVSGQRGYVTSQLNDRLVIFDLSNPSEPDSLGSTDESLANPYAVYVAGKYAYVASYGQHSGTVIKGGLAIFDISDPRQIRLRDFIDTNLARPTDVFVAGNYAYVTSEFNNQMAIFDVSDPRPGRVTAKGFASGAFSGPRAIFVSAPYAYVVSDGSNDLVILDVSDPDNVVKMGSIGTNLSAPRDVFVAGDLAYVASSGNDRLAIFDVSDPANIVARGFADTGVDSKPVSLFAAGNRVYVASERADSLSVFEVNHLQAPTLQTGNLQTAYLDVLDNAVVNNDLAVHGGLQVGGSGALIDGALSVTGSDDSHILGALSIGGVGALVSDTVFLTRTMWVAAPTHALDVVGEGRFRVNDYHNLVLRSANAGSDEDAYIDLVRSSQTTVMTPTARIEFDVADPVTHTTSMRFYTQGGDDSQPLSRLEITSYGDVRPGADAAYLLGIPGRRWHTIYSANGMQTTSDGRLKENVVGLPYGLDAVRRLRPVAFTWKDGLDDQQHQGLIAQEVAHVLPELVVAGDDPDGTLSMNYAEIVPVLVKAIQEQQDEIDTQAGQIEALEARLSALEAGPADQAGPTGTLKFLSVFGFGGLVLGAVVVAGIRRNGV